MTIARVSLTMLDGIGGIICQNARLGEYINFCNWSKIRISTDEPETGEIGVGFSIFFYAGFSFFFLSFLLAEMAGLSVSYIKMFVSSSTSIFATGAMFESQPTSRKMAKLVAVSLFLFTAFCTVLLHFSPC